MEKFDINKVANGAIAEQIAMEAKRVYKNITDPNTDKEKARKLVITVTFKPKKEDSEVVDVSAVTKTTLQPMPAIVTQMLVEKDSDGNVAANEWDRFAMKNQTTLEDLETENIVDFQKKA